MLCWSSGHKPLGKEPAVFTDVGRPYLRRRRARIGVHPSSTPFPLTEEKKLLGLPRTFWPKLAQSTNCGRELEKRMYRTASAFSLVTAVQKTSQIRHLVHVCLRTPHTWLPSAAQPAPALPRKRAGTSGSKQETREAGCGTQRAATVLPCKIKMSIAFAPPP